MSQIQETNKEQQDTQGENTDLNLNTDIIHNRTTTYTSLSELYGVQLFTNQRLEECKNYEANINVKEKNVKENIFVDKAATKDIDKEITEELFQSPMVVTKQQDYTESTTASKGMFVVGAVLISIIFMIVLIRYLKAGKKKRTIEETSYE